MAPGTPAARRRIVRTVCVLVMMMTTAARADGFTVVADAQSATGGAALSPSAGNSFDYSGVTLGVAYRR
jgi:hypothetical protein